MSGRRATWVGSSSVLMMMIMSLLTSIPVVHVRTTDLLPQRRVHTNRSVQIHFHTPFLPTTRR